MKKVLLFFSIVAMGLSMNSCLDGNNKFSDIAVCYVTSDDQGTVYGRTSSSLFIKTEAMGSTMLPGEFKYFLYNWDESYGMTPIVVGEQTYSAYNVLVSSEVVDVPKVDLYYISAPVLEEDDAESPTFIEVGTRAFDTWGNYMDDRWVCYCSYKIKKGQTSSITFYHDPENSDYQDANYLYINVHLDISGTPESETESIETKFFAVSMSSLRARFDESKRIKYRYYVKNGSLIQSTTSPDVLNMQIEQ